METKLRASADVSAAAAPDRAAKMSGIALDALRKKFPARPVPDEWPTSVLSRGEVLDLLSAPPFNYGTSNGHQSRLGAVRAVLTWLESFPGESWQMRWRNSRAEEMAHTELTQAVSDWFLQRRKAFKRDNLGTGVLVLVCADVIRVNPSWLLSRGSNLREMIFKTRDPLGFEELRKISQLGDDWTRQTARWAQRKIAAVMAFKGGGVKDITVGDCLELLDIPGKSLAWRYTGNSLLYSWLHALGCFPSDAPTSLRGIRLQSGQLTPEQLVDRFPLENRPVRDLLVDYLKERQPGIDYNTLEKLSRTLALNFWREVEKINPGICSLRLDADVAAAWKDRIRTKTSRVRTPDRTSIEVSSPRMGARQEMLLVRAFYLDIAQWAAHDPSRWGLWAAPCPISDSEVNLRKEASHRKARMHQRTRERLPVLPTLVSSVAEYRKSTERLLAAAQGTTPGATFWFDGEEFLVPPGNRIDTRVVELDTGRRRNLTHEEHCAFWTWAVVEILRHTGIRNEELLELSHHSITQYRLPTTGELVPLLQIAPSKTDEERMLLVTPELADVLSAVVSRVRGPSGAVPVIPCYDHLEKVWNSPMPLLLQRKFGGENSPLTRQTISNMLDAALERAGIVDVTGEPIKYRPHDFRRMFVTEAVMNGLPPHIAQVICGHKNINTTMGYKAIYPAEAIEAHRAFIARRRALRPSEEYRTPTPEEWDQFLGHFEKRKLSIGTCGRAFGTPCIHEHACIRCSMLRPDPDQRQRLLEIRDNLIDRIAEAEREGWLGEVEGLRVSLSAAEGKIAQLDHSVRIRSESVDLGMPSFTQVAGRQSTAEGPGSTSSGAAH
ncbi:tyrosine-type recombinase/integrase [Streptomyces sp. NPDC001719]